MDVSVGKLDHNADPRALPADSDSAAAGWSLGICIVNKHPLPAPLLWSGGQRTVLEKLL